jgi:hypothetical protein
MKARWVLKTICCVRQVRLGGRVGKRGRLFHRISDRGHSLRHQIERAVERAGGEICGTGLHGAFDRAADSEAATDPLGAPLTATGAVCVQFFGLECHRQVLFIDCGEPPTRIFNFVV